MGTEFNKQQFLQAYPAGIEDTYWNRARNRIILNIARRYKLNNILDVGCGRGIVTSYLHKSGLSVIGVDMGSPSSSAKTGCAIYYNTEAGDLPDDIRKQVQAITLFDVIEHIEHPREFLKRLTEQFPNLEYLMITVPARRELWTNFDNYYGHFRRYTLQSVKKEVEDSGFNIIFSRYFFHILYPLIRMNNIFFKNRDIDIKAPEGLFSRMIHKASASLFYSEIFLVPGRVRGSSIVAVCKKTKTT